MRTLLAGLIFWVAAPALATCLEYGPATVELRGKVVTRDYPGPPNYTDIAAGDQKHTVFLLRLEAPLCTRASAGQPAAEGIGELQLAFDWASPKSSAVYLEVASAIGSSLTLSGELFRGAAREHRTQVLLLVLDKGTG